MNVIKLICPKCGKEILGLSKGQADYNLSAHKLSKKCKLNKKTIKN